jgi:general stress protein 26
MSTADIETQNRIRKILLESPFAVLGTIGENSQPHARWMSPIFAGGSLKEFHALAAPHSRKVAQLQANANVCWVFSTPAYDEVVTLYGTASIETDPILRACIWENMPDKQRAFILRSDENLEFSLVRTEVHTIEYLRPQTGETHPVTFSP